MYILASASPRRKELLKLITDDFKIIKPCVDEVYPDDIKAEEIPQYLACLKAGSIAKDYPSDTVIGADTLVLLGDKILGKPKDRKEAEAMLTLLSGNVHKVITGCAVFCGGKCRAFSVVTEVEFYKLESNEIADYISTGEPFDKAGAYGIQNKGALLVKEVRGDYFNVVGLPIAALKRFLKK